MLRYDRPFRETSDDLEDILVPTPTGAHIPIGELATVAFTEGPPMIRSENARLTGWVFVDIEGRDLGGYVEDARRTVDNAVSLPPGYAIEWSGQYEQIQAAGARLRLAIPSAIGLIFLLLMLHFGRIDRTAIIMLSLPFGLIGGLWAVWLAGYNLSVAVAVGFIALGGVAAETAVVMVMYLDNHVRADRPSNQAPAGALHQGGRCAAAASHPDDSDYRPGGVGPDIPDQRPGIGCDAANRAAHAGRHDLDHGSYTDRDSRGVLRVGWAEARRPWVSHAGSEGIPWERGLPALAEDRMSSFPGGLTSAALGTRASRPRRGQDVLVPRGVNGRHARRVTAR